MVALRQGCWQVMHLLMHQLLVWRLVRVRGAWQGAVSGSEALPAGLQWRLHLLLLPAPLLLLLPPLLLPPLPMLLMAAAELCGELLFW